MTTRKSKATDGAAPVANCERLAALEWCIGVCDHAVEHYKGPIALKIRREIAVEAARIRSSLAALPPPTGEPEPYPSSKEIERRLYAGEPVRNHPIPIHQADTPGVDEPPRRRKSLHPDVLAAHAQFGGDLEDMQRRYNSPQADESELLSLRRKVEEQRRALKPFGAIADIYDHPGGNRPTSGSIMEWADHRVGERILTVEMLRAARALAGDRP